MLHVGFGACVNPLKIAAIVSSETSPVTRRIQAAREEGQLIDCTKGRKTRTAIFLESGQIVVSSITPVKLAVKWNEEIWLCGGAAAMRGEGTA